jgi:acyl-CoA synthetase (AMP-forming)/AMP-acid ligase II
MRQHCHCSVFTQSNICNTASLLLIYYFYNNSWLPQYHDMGLIVGIMAPFIGGYRMHYIAPTTFIRSPVLWLELMSRHKCHWTAAPDFAFALCVRKFSEQQKALERLRTKGNSSSASSGSTLDLSSVRFMQSGAEPIRTETVTQFETVFSKHGLPPHWFCATYGMAESVVGVSYVFLGRGAKRGQVSHLLACTSSFCSLNFNALQLK